MGYLGVATGLLGLLVLQEQDSNDEEKTQDIEIVDDSDAIPDTVMKATSFQQNIQELKDNSMAINLVFAGIFRLISLFSMRYFLPIYFQAAFSDNY